MITERFRLLGTPKFQNPAQKGQLLVVLNKIHEVPAPIVLRMYQTSSPGPILRKDAIDDIRESYVWTWRSFKSSVHSPFYNNMSRFPAISHVSWSKNPMVSIHGYILLFDSIIADNLIINPCSFLRNNFMESKQHAPQTECHSPTTNKKVYTDIATIFVREKLFL